MTVEDKQALAAAIAGELEDSAYGTSDGAARYKTARLVVDRIEPALHQLGWMPPGTLEQVHAWGRRLSELPEHHINRDVLNSHLAELRAIC